MQNNQCEHDSQWSKEACFACATQVWLAVNHNTSVTSGNEFDVRSELHGQVSLAAVNQIYVGHETMNGCKILKIHLRLLLKCKYSPMLTHCILVTPKCVLWQTVMQHFIWVYTICYDKKHSSMKDILYNTFSM